MYKINCTEMFWLVKTRKSSQTLASQRDFSNRYLVFLGRFMSVFQLSLGLQNSQITYPEQDPKRNVLKSGQSMQGCIFILHNTQIICFLLCKWLKGLINENLQWEFAPPKKITCVQCVCKLSPEHACFSPLNGNSHPIHTKGNPDQITNYQWKDSFLSKAHILKCALLCSC